MVKYSDNITKVKLRTHPIPKIPMKIKFILTLFLPVLFFTGLSCNSPTEPKEAEDHGPDTTSHTMTFQVYEFGEWPSYFHCSHAVSDTEIYAGGEIVVGRRKIDNSDSIANLFRWNGHGWRNQSLVLDRVIRYNPFTTGKSILRITSIFSTKTSVWFVIGTSIFLKQTGPNKSLYRDKYTPEFLGSTEVNIPLLSTNALWGSSDDNMYFVGDSGRIVHYNGKTWSEMTSPTKMPLVSIYGNEDGSELFATGNDAATGKGHLLRYTPQTGWVIFRETDFYNRFPDFLSGVYYITSIWGAPDTRSNQFIFLLAGTSVIRQLSDGNWLSLYDDNIWRGGSIYKIAGTGLNDIFFVSLNSLYPGQRLVHYNGKTWHLYKEISDREDLSLIWYPGASKHYFVLSGTSLYGSRGVILMGTR